MTSLDPATEFLIRKDRKALAKVLKKKESTISVVQAKTDSGIGLLAATNQRLVFVYKRGLRYRRLEVAKADVANLSMRPGRYGTVHVASKHGNEFIFEMMQKGAAEAFMEKVVPTPPVKTQKSVQVRKDGPMTFKPTKPPLVINPHSHPREQKSHDPLSATKAEKLARLERLHEKGLLSPGEYRWQRDALERSN